jgi:hypothetical protein
MDFIDGLPRSRRFNSVLVVVDKLSRYAHFVGLAHPYTVSTVASAYMDNVHKLHGMPESIVSDRDSIFTSRFWCEMAAMTGTKLHMSSSHHPETDGTTERMNQCLEAYLDCFTHACLVKWAQWLSLAEFWYNASPHLALDDKSPFEVLYGHSPRHFGISVADACAIPDLDVWLKDWDLTLRLLQQHLERVRARMKAQADKRRSDRVFHVSDSVFMKLQPYIQSSVAPRAHHKLLFKYYGPFLVLERIGDLAYRLQLTEKSRIHPVLHVSQLKKALGPNCQVQAELPPPDAQFAIPVRVLQRRFRHHNATSIPQVLIQWSGQPDTLATWEDFEALKQRFPKAPPWGQAAYQGRGSVNTVPSDQASWAASADTAQPTRRTRRPATRYASSD